MNADDVYWLKIWMLASPFMVFGLALFVYWLTGSLDRREDRRQQDVENARRASRRYFRQASGEAP